MVPQPPQKKKDKEPSKRQRHCTSLTVKLEIIRRAEGGERHTAIAKEMKLPRSTISTIIRFKDSYKKQARSTGRPGSLYLRKKRDPNMEKMESLLIAWIEDRVQRHMPISKALIKDKASTLWDDVRQEDGEDLDASFQASNGWFWRFKRRANLHNISLCGEAASADLEAAQRFPASFLRLVEDAGYHPKQVFNIDETGLFWKKMPKR